MSSRGRDVHMTRTNAGTSNATFSWDARRVAMFGTFAALIAVLDLIQIRMPPPIEYFSFVQVAILPLGIMLKPRRAFPLIATGAVIGQLISSLVGGYYAELPVFLLGAFVARGGQGLVMSVLSTRLIRQRGGPRHGKEVLVMVAGIAWEIAGYMLIGIPYYVAIMGWPFLPTFLFYAGISIEFIFIPAGIATTYGIRRGFNSDYLDALLFGNANEDEHGPGSA